MSDMPGLVATELVEAAVRSGKPISGGGRRARALRQQTQVSGTPSGRWASRRAAAALVSGRAIADDL